MALCFHGLREQVGFGDKLERRTPSLRGVGWCSPLAVPLDFTFLVSLSVASPHSLACGKRFWNFLEAGLSLEVFLSFSLYFPLFMCHVQVKVLSFLFA